MPRLVLGEFHLKNKLCDNCRERIMVPLTQARAPPFP